MTRILFFLLILNCAYAQNLYYTPNAKDVELVNHTFFSLGYDESVEQAKWTYYTLETGQANGRYPREKKFYKDPYVSTGSSHPRDFRGLGVDRGHLVPALDMSFNYQAMFNSFYMSNISPQYASFNRGIWSKLEKKVRALSRFIEKLHVFSGPLFLNTKKKIGRVYIPSHFYKIVFIEQDSGILSFSFIIENKKQISNLDKFLVTIDHVEKLSGVDFFSQLRVTEQAIFERKINTKIWKDFIKEIK